MHALIQISAPTAFPTLWVQATQALRDTIVTKQMVSDPGVLAKVGTIANAVMTLAMLLLSVALVLAAWGFLGMYKRVRQLIDRVEQDVLPLARSANAVVEDVHAITASVKDDVLQVQHTIAEANATLRKATGGIGERIDQFSALLEVIQEEAEATFMTAAATVRGVRRRVEQVLDQSQGDDDDDDDSTRASGPGRTRPTVKARPATWDVDEDEYT